LHQGFARLVLGQQVTVIVQEAGVLILKLHQARVLGNDFFKDCHALLERLFRLGTLAHLAQSET
jgi:hypothetical protein